MIAGEEGKEGEKGRGFRDSLNQRVKDNVEILSFKLKILNILL